MHNKEFGIITIYNLNYLSIITIIKILSSNVEKLVVTPAAKTDIL